MDWMDNENNTKTIFDLLDQNYEDLVPDQNVFGISYSTSENHVLLESPL